jgi:hypothetical protein
MLKGLWSRLSGRRARADIEHEVERERMTPAERRVDAESFEDRQADLATRARLGGGDPDRLLPDDDPSRR